MALRVEPDAHLDHIVLDELAGRVVGTSHLTLAPAGSVRQESAGTISPVLPSGTPRGAPDDVFSDFSSRMSNSELAWCAAARPFGDAWAVALPLRNLAIIAHRQRDYRTARRLLEESLHGLRGLGEKWFLSRSIETLAEVMASAGEHERAAHLFGAAETLREAIGASVLAFYRADYDRAIDTVRAALGHQAFESCWVEGRMLAPEEAVAYALGESSLSTG